MTDSLGSAWHTPWIQARRGAARSPRCQAWNVEHILVENQVEEEAAEGSSGDSCPTTGRAIYERPRGDGEGPRPRDGLTPAPVVGREIF